MIILAILITLTWGAIFALLYNQRILAKWLKDRPQGSPGPPGPQGPKGDKGYPGATGPLPSLTPVWKAIQANKEEIAGFKEGMKEWGEDYGNDLIEIRENIEAIAKSVAQMRMAHEDRPQGSSCDDKACQELQEVIREFRVAQMRRTHDDLKEAVIKPKRKK